MSGHELYELFCQGHDWLHADPPAWDELDPPEQHAWAELASQWPEAAE